MLKQLKDLRSSTFNPAVNDSASHKSVYSESGRTTEVGHSLKSSSFKTLGRKRPRSHRVKAAPGPRGEVSVQRPEGGGGQQRGQRRAPGARDPGPRLIPGAPRAGQRPPPSRILRGDDTRDGRREPVPPSDSDAGPETAGSAGAPTARRPPRRLTPGLASQARSVGSRPPRRRPRPRPARARAATGSEEASGRHFPVGACRASPSALRLRPGRAPGSAGLGARPRCGPPPGWASCTAWDAERDRLAAGRAGREGAERHTGPRLSCRRD